jgi:hypothetical protein
MSSIISQIERKVVIDSEGYHSKYVQIILIFSKCGRKIWQWTPKYSLWKDVAQESEGRGSDHSITRFSWLLVIDDRFDASVVFSCFLPELNPRGNSQIPSHFVRRTHGVRLYYSGKFYSPAAI